MGALVIRRHLGVAGTGAPNVTTGTVTGSHRILVICVVRPPGLANHRILVTTYHATGDEPEAVRIALEENEMTLDRPA
jgi:hypothetical protein